MDYHLLEREEEATLAGRPARHDVDTHQPQHPPVFLTCPRKRVDHPRIRKTRWEEVVNDKVQSLVSFPQRDWSTISSRESRVASWRFFLSA
jgi:hypothetical protein